jgi:predicted nicotinamide N-methyase
VDEDGDLVCRRKRRKRSVQHLIICHALATRLNDVGLQVWRGALLLCDHIMTCQSLDSAVVLELGAGCGMTSLAASLAGARTVFCTDAHRPSLENAQRNANANNVHSALRVRQLDWSAVDIWPQQSDDRFGWGTADLHALKRATVLLAADCVYDDSGTTALVPMLARLLPALDASAVCFISLERRINFCLAGLRPRAPAAEHFHRVLRQQKSLAATQLPTATVPQSFEYERASTLELWRVACDSCQMQKSCVSMT